MEEQVIEELPDVPPAVLLLVQEMASAYNDGLGVDYVAVRKRLKSMLRELRDQSEAHLATSMSSKIPKHPSHELDIHLHGGLDIFSERRRSCANISCRIKVADQLSRSIGLIADRAWVTDHFSDRFIDFGRATNEKLDDLMMDTLILLRVWPLIDAGILRFRPPCYPSCKSCLEHFEEQVALIAEQVAAKFSGQFRVTNKPDGHYFIETGDCFEPPIWQHSIKSKKTPPTAKAYAENLIYDEVYSALWVGRDAVRRGGAIFSNSRVGLAGLLQQEGRFIGRKPLTLLDQERTVQVPWVSELEPHQVVELRRAASRALPVFREHMAKALSVDDDLGLGASKSAEVVQGLRIQAAEVRAELQAAKNNSPKILRGAGSLLALGFSVYGIATDQPVAAMSGILNLINLLIAHSGHEKEAEKLASRPGYVLLKAQDILDHAH